MSFTPLSVSSFSPESIGIYKAFSNNKDFSELKTVANNAIAYGQSLDEYNGALNHNGNHRFGLMSQLQVGIISVIVGIAASILFLSLASLTVGTVIAGLSIGVLSFFATATLFSVLNQNQITAAGQKLKERADIQMERLKQSEHIVRQFCKTDGVALLQNWESRLPSNLIKGRLLDNVHQKAKLELETLVAHYAKD